MISENLSDPANHDSSSATLTTQAPEDQYVILRYLRLLWQHRRVFSWAAMSAALASITVALLIPTQFRSVTRLMPPDNQGAPLGALAALTARAGGIGVGGFAGDLLGVKSSGALFVGMLNSDTVREEIIAKFDLQKAYRTPEIEDARNTLAEHTTISEDRKSGIITIEVKDHDPKRAAAICDAYVEQLDRRVEEVSTSSARRERVFLEGRLQAVKADLDAAAKNFSDFASKNSAIDIPAQGKAMVEAAATLQGELIAAQAELSGLQQIYAEQNVRVRSARARVKELQRKLNEIGGQGGDATDVYPSIRKLPLLGVTYADLYRQTKVEETIYELLTQQYELAKVEEAKEVPVVKVLDRASVPRRKVFPPRTLLVLVGTLLGMASCFLWIVAKSKWESIELTDPRKMFVTEVLLTIQSRLWRSSQDRVEGTSWQRDQGSRPVPYQEPVLDQPKRSSR
jgi:uncharacterized protein involved in exopolysaccharide biosynthesis